MIDHDALVQAHPGLILRGTQPLSGMALAAKNIRYLLKIHYPDTRFSVVCEKAAWACSIHIGYTCFPDGPASEEIEAIVKPFVSGKYDSEKEERIYFTDPEGETFRKIFGSTPGVHYQANPASAQDIAEQRAKQLSQACTRTRLSSLRRL